MVNRQIVTAILAVLAILIIAAAAWYYVYRYHTLLVSPTADGGSITLACQPGQYVRVVTATYTPPAAKAVAVTAQLQTLLSALGGATYVVSSAALGQPAGGMLSFRYRCAGTPAPQKAGFRPIPVSPCADPGAPDCAVDTTGRGAAGTVAWEPYSTQSRVSLERGAETPEAAERLNPVTGLGKTSSLRALGDRYRRNEALQRLSIYETQPGQPGFMEEVGDDAPMSLLAQIARRSPGAPRGAPASSRATTDTDAGFPDFYTDGPFGEALLCESLTARSGGPR